MLKIMNSRLHSYVCVGLILFFLFLNDGEDSLAIETSYSGVLGNSISY